MRTSPFSAAIDRVPGTRPIGSGAAEVRVAVRSQQSWRPLQHTELSPRRRTRGRAPSMLDVQDSLVHDTL